MTAQATDESRAIRAPLHTVVRTRGGERVLLDSDAPLRIPVNVAICPYCDTQLTANIEGCTQDPQDKTWYADCFTLDCETEPEDMDSDEWEEWMRCHSDMPYVYMLPVHTKVEAWLKQNYRFKE